MAEARACSRRFIALFSLFESAMLSASDDDITARARDWLREGRQPYLKKQYTFYLRRAANEREHRIGFSFLGVHKLFL